MHRNGMVHTCSSGGQCSRPKGIFRSTLSLPCPQLLCSGSRAADSVVEPSSADSVVEPSSLFQKQGEGHKKKKGQENTESKAHEDLEKSFGDYGFNPTGQRWGSST